MDKLQRTEKRLRNVGGEKVRKVCPSVRTLYSAVSVTRHGKISPLWQNIATLAKFKSIWATYEPTLANILCYWANLHPYQCPNIENSLTIWSH